MKSSIILLLVSVLAGCIGGNTRLTTFYQLTADATEPVSSAGKDYAIGLGPITLPGILDRPQIVTKTSPNQLELGEFDRWGEQLKENVGRVIGQNLMRYLDTEFVSIYPWPRYRHVKYRIAIDVLQMDGVLGQQVGLDVIWTILDAEGRQEIAINHYKGVEKVNDHLYETFVIAQSRLLAILSKQIAESVIKLPIN